MLKYCQAHKKQNDYSGGKKRLTRSELLLQVSINPSIQPEVNKTQSHGLVGMGACVSIPTLYIQESLTRLVLRSIKLILSVISN